MTDREPHNAGNLSPRRTCLLWACALGLSVLSACGGGSGGVTQAPGSGSAVTVGGSVSGVLEPGLVLQLNGAHDISVDVDRPFTFDTAVPSGSAFEVSIAQQPPSQRCELVNRDSGVAGAEPVVDVGVVCSSLVQSSTVRGAVTGVLQPGVLLTLTQGLGFNQERRFDDDGFFEFSSQLTTGSPYVLEVRSPPLLVCDIFGGAAGVVGQAPPATVACTPQPSPDRVMRRIGGKVQGFVSANAAVTLRLNGRIQARLSAAGAFTFSEPLPAGSRYEVGLLQAPSGVTCELARGAGVVGDTDITDIQVNCQAPPPANLTRGAISGLKGSGLVLRQGLETLTLSPGATGFTFLIPPENGFYRVEIAAQPTSPQQICEFADGLGQGFLPNSPPIAVSMTCSTVQRPPAGLGLSLDQNVLKFSADAGATVASQSVFGWVKGVTVKQAPTIQVSPELASFNIVVNLLDAQTARMTVTPPTSDRLGPGTYAGRITITQCVDSECLQQAAGSPQVVAVTYTVRPSPAPRTLQLSEHGLALTASADGAVLARSLTVHDSGAAAAGWRAATDAPWLTVTPSGDSGSTLQVVADPGGLPDGEHLATITVRSVDPTLPQADSVRVALFKTGASRTNQLRALPSSDVPLVLADPVRPLFYRFAGGTLVATNAYTGADTASLPLSSDPLARNQILTAAPASDGSRLYVFTLGSGVFGSLKMTVVDLLSWKILRNVDVRNVLAANFSFGRGADAVPAVVSGRKVVVLGGFRWSGQAPRLDAISHNHVILDGDSGAVLGHLLLSDGTDRSQLFAGRDPSSVYAQDPAGVTQYRLRTNAAGNVLGERVGALLPVKRVVSLAVSPDGRKLAIAGEFADDPAGATAREFVAESGRFQELRKVAEVPNATVAALRYDGVGRLAVRFESFIDRSPPLDLYGLDGTLSKRVLLPGAFGSAPDITFTSDGLIMLFNDQLLGVPPP